MRKFIMSAAFVAALFWAHEARAQIDDCNGICEAGHGQAGLTGEQCYRQLIHELGHRDFGVCSSSLIVGSSIYKGPGHCNRAWNDRAEIALTCIASGAGGTCYMDGAIGCGFGASYSRYSYHMSCSQNADGVPSATASPSRATCGGTNGVAGSGSFSSYACNGATGSASLSTCAGGICNTIALTPD